MLQNALITVTAFLALASGTACAPPPPGHTKPSTPASDDSLTARLRSADSAVERYTLLPKDEDFLFDFNKSAVPFANSQTFPALVGSGISLTLGTVPPCGMASLHIHPRASEIFAVLSGHLHIEAIPELGVTDEKGKPRVIRMDLRANQVTVFAAGVYHTQMNPECEPATIAAAFSSEDPGTSLIMPQAFGLSDELLRPLFGQALTGKEVQRLRGAIPQGPSIMVDECLARCGLQN